MLTIGLFYNFKNPKHKAVFGYYVVGSLIMYILMISAVLVYKLAVKPDLYCLLLFLCVISPFVIGKLVKYETLKPYTAAQIMCFAASLFALLLQ